MAAATARYYRAPNRTPAIIVSILLHAAIVAATLVVWPWSHKVKPIQVTPVTLLTSAELAKLTAAEQADTAEQAQTPEPTPVAETAPPAPEPAPVPTPPPAPAPQPKPEPKPAPTPSPKPAPAPAPTPTPKTPPKPAAPTSKTSTAKSESFNLDRLAEQLAKDTKAKGPPKSNAAKGPAKAETDIMARLAEGQSRATTQTSLGQIQAKLIRLWNPNCEVEGAANIIVPIRMSLNQDGSLAKAELANGQAVREIKDPVMQAAASRALSAVSRGSPYDNLPKDDYSYWKTIILNFDAKKACRA